MEVGDIVYLAFATIMIIVALHVATFWIARTIHSPKPKIVYLERPAPPPPAPPAQPVYKEPAQQIQVPTYDTPPQPSANNMSLGTLPPPIETRTSK